MNINYYSFLTKFAFFLFSLLIIFPISTIENFYLFLLIFTLLFFSSLNTNIKYYNLSIFIFILVILSFFFDNQKFKISKGLVIINENSKQFYKDGLPSEVFNFFLDKFEFYNQNSKCKANDNKCWRSFDPKLESDKFEPYNIIFSKTKPQYTKNTNFKLIDNIKIDNLKSLKINEINSLRYNYFWTDKYDLVRENIPYYISFQITDFLIDSKLCWKGNIFLEDNNFKFLRQYNKNKKCIIIDKTYVDKIIFAVDFGSSENIKELKWLYGDSYIDLNDDLNNFLENNNLDIEINKTKKIYIYESILNITKLLIFFLAIYVLIKFNFTNFLFSISFPIVFLLLLKIINVELLNGFNIYTGGNDGILYNSYGTKLFLYLKSYNFHEFFRGVESVFYFPSSIRYFLALNKFLFQDASYGYIFIGYLLVFIFYFIFKNLFGIKYTILFIILFFFTRALEGYAFSLYSLLQHINEADAEPLAIFLFFSSFYIFIKNFDNKYYRSFDNFLIGFLIFLSVSVRPNYLPTGFLLVLLHLYYSYFRFGNKNSLFTIFGFSFILFIPLHNIYYGNSFVLLSSGAHHNTNAPIIIYFNAIRDIFNFNFTTENIKIIYNQINKWIQPKEIHYIISFFLIVIALIFKNIKTKIKLVSLLAISQHAVLLIFEPANRYSYLAWMLTFIALYYILIVAFEKLFIRLGKIKF